MKEGSGGIGKLYAWAVDPRTSTHRLTIGRRED